MNLEEGISVCIPARNEENTIEATINSSLNQDFSGDMEILVCANDCTDSTEYIVEKISKEYENVKLLRSEPGKANAWNKLFNKANYNNLIFLDADILVRKGTFQILYDDISSDPDIIASTGNQIKVYNGLSFFSRIFNLPTIVPPFYCIPGRLYCLNKERFKERMEKFGYSSMPEDIINEDLWLTLILEDRKNNAPIKKYWKYNTDAAVYFRPTGIKDVVRERKRITEGLFQLEREHPELGFVIERENNWEQKFRRWYNQWKLLDNNIEKLFIPVVFLGRKVLLRALTQYAEKKALDDYKAGNASNVWEPTTTSKLPYSKKIQNILL